MAIANRHERRTNLTRARLLDAALAVMLERGYDAFSLGEVTERADLGTGTLYLHFRDKRSLYEAVVRRDLEGIYSRWLDELNLPESRLKGPMAAQDLLAYAAQFFAADRARARLYLLDGPMIETWFIEDAGRALSAKLGGQSREDELAAHLVMGAGLAAFRWAVKQDAPVTTQSLVAMVADFCARGLTGMTVRFGHELTRKPRKTNRRSRRLKVPK